MVYRILLRPIFFLLDAEAAHAITFFLLSLLLRLPFISLLFPRPQRPLKKMGLHFTNPVGLAAGFDKDGLIGSRWGILGFGFVELGTVTPRPQTGNPRPRLFRLPKDKAIINRMGFNNAGVNALVKRIQKMPKNGTLLGANIGKNKDTPAEEAASDYLYCFERLYEWVDYFVVNVSSPNTPGLRALQEKGPLTEILKGLQDRNPLKKPLLLKIAPDLGEAQLDDIIEVALSTQITGIVATNTTLSREGLTSDKEQVEKIGAGGLSGAPLYRHSNTVLAYIKGKSRDQLILIGVGGIMHPEDAEQKISAGADLIQLYSGFVYEGPGLIRKIVKHTQKITL